MQGRIFSNNSFGENKVSKKSLKEFKIIKKIGFDYIELVVDKNLFFFKLLNYYKFFSKRGIFYSINIDYFVKKNFFANLNNSNKIIDKIITFSQKNKIKTIVLPCIGKNHLSESKLFNLINILDSKIKKKNIKIALELNYITKKNKRRLKKNIGICYDTGNLGKNSFSFLKKNYKYINHIHIKDINKINKKNTFLGKGFINLKKIIKFILKNKYKNSITLETFFRKDKKIEDAIFNLNQLKSLL